jgi:hypothetical protein
MKLIRMLAAGSAVAAVSLCATAVGQEKVKVNIDGGASYEQALKCYEYYDIAQQVADARAAKAEAGSDAQKDLQSHSATDKLLKTSWNKHIDETKGKKSNKVVDDDLAKAGAPIIADANAGLGGNAAASARYEAIQAKCKTYEKVEKVG